MRVKELILVLEEIEEDYEVTIDGFSLSEHIYVIENDKKVSLRKGR